MSTGFNEWEWTDWNNGWTTEAAPPNYNRPPPKDTNSTTQMNHHNRGAVAFEKGWEEWGQLNSIPEVQGNSSSNVYSKINNNPVTQVENREIAPPDNKSSNESKFNSKAPEMPHQPNQHINNIAPASKMFQPYQIQTVEAKQTEHQQINNYFDSRLNNHGTTSQPKLFYPPNYNAQIITSDPPSNVFHHQQHTEKEAVYMPQGHYPANVIDPVTVKPVAHREEMMMNTTTDSKPKRFTPPPQQLTYRYPPPPTHLVPLIPPNPYEVISTEVHDSNNVPRFNTPSYQAANHNVIAPIAASSPVPTSVDLAENQEQIPENREYPDNAENIAQEIKALSINTPKEQAEPEVQAHCAIDRNQYLETGQFSSRKDPNPFLQNIEINDEGEAPPPGLHRLVTGQGYEPFSLLKTEGDNWAEKDANLTPMNPSSTSATRQSTPLSSIGESESREEDNKEGRREVPGEAEPLQGRVVLGQVPTPPQDMITTRGDRERERLERMVVGEQGQSGGNTSDDYRQSRQRLQRHRRTDSSYEDEERDYSSDRDRRNEDHRRRDDRPRRRREHRSPEYRSDEEYEDRRGYQRNSRERDSRRMREYSPERSSYRGDYRDYYRADDSRSHRLRYYGREYDDYHRDNQRSRPSSRSGSDYRHQMKHPVRMMPGNQYYHDPYATAPPSLHDYSLKYTQRTAEYFERMRLVDPAGYAAWYSQYMQGKYIQETSGRAFSSDRASVHSGQSSSNQRHGVSTPQDNVEDSAREGEVDYIPRLYDSAHIRGNLDGHGRLVIVDPHYPLDKQRATINICRLSQLALDKDSEDFFQTPGPFIPGVTHRNTVLQYLKRISDKATKTSEKLLYDLVHMTVKGNGEIIGSDVAELLMESYNNSVQSGNQSIDEPPTPPAISSKQVTARFRELLMQGNKTEALDWAIDNDAWGHALFLASKMDERTHNNIMLRFANSIPHNDPLQTLYQLMSGFVPQAATCCSDKKWSDWRPHLAMILSNPSGNPGLDRQAIITLGDSLNTCGRLFASQFCYVTAQVEFSEFKQDAKLVLLGSSHNQEFSKFSSCRAIMLTMCYEYGLKLKHPSYNIPTLQVYKLILAARLIDSGRIRNALQYCELLAQEMLGSKTFLSKSFVTTVIDFSSRLKMFDPVLTLSGNTDKDPDWLSNLKNLYENLPDDHDESVTKNYSPLTHSEPNNDHNPPENYQVLNDPQNLYVEPVPMMNRTVQGFNSQQSQIPHQPQINHQPQITHQPQLNHQPLIPRQPSQKPGRQQFEPEIPEEVYHQQQFIPTSSAPMSMGYQPVTASNEAPGSFDITSVPEQHWEPQRAQPSIIQSSSESSQAQRNNFFKASEEQLKLNEVGADNRKKEGKVSSQDGKANGKNEEQSGGWFGGIWGKIAMRPKNQMRLPDDSNPSIIWDDKKKKWVNLDGESEASGNVKPPPKFNEYTPPQNSQNKYKIQKGKMMKSNYVDVMGNSEKMESSKPPSIVPNIPPVMKANYFIPPPVEGNENAPIDFISPAPNLPDPSDNPKPQLSRCSSVSSLSREVQFYMAPQPVHIRQKMQGNPNLNPPIMYNPSRYQS